jgi:hypothetical protein
VPTEFSYVTKVTLQNNGSPQISRALRDREEQEDLVGSCQSGTAAHILDRVKAVQELIRTFGKSREGEAVVAAGPSTGRDNLAVSFEQVSGEAQYGGAPKADALTVGGGGGPVVPAARVSQPAQRKRNNAVVNRVSGILCFLLVLQSKNHFLRLQIRSPVTQKLPSNEPWEMFRFCPL